MHIPGFIAFLPYITTKKWVRWTAGSLTLLILGVVITNIGLGWYYTRHTYPNTYIGSFKIGQVALDADHVAVDQTALLPHQLDLTLNSQHQIFTASELGLSLNQPELARRLQAARSWLPAYNLFTQQRVALPVTIDSTQAKSVVAALAHQAEVQAKDASIIRSNGQFTIQSPSHGSQLDTDHLSQAIIAGVEAGKTTIALPTSTVMAEVTSAELNGDLQVLQQQLTNVITFSHGGKTYQASQADMVGWYVPDKNSFSLDTTAISAWIKQMGQSQWGIVVANSAQAAALTQSAITSQQSKTIALTAVISRLSYTYCVASRGVDSSALPALEAKLASVLNDARGWGMGGTIRFVENKSACNLKVWLSSSDQMTTFSSACDSIWSCTVYPNVILNFDRWTGGTASWNATGRSLDEYQTMAINHEVGHWLGFGHVSCGGIGQLAPIMQQQSVNLQGCLFNAWPLPSEQQKLRAKLGV